MAGEDFEERLGRIESSIGQLTSFLEAKGGKSDDDDKGGKSDMKSLDSFSDAELEQMSRRDVIQLIMGSVQAGFKDLQKQVSEEITNTRSEVSTANIRQEVREAAAKHPEIKHLKDELRAMIEENPDLSVERMVALIKAEQPDKYEEAVKKYEQESSGKKDDDKEGDDEGKEGDDDKGGKKQDSTKEDDKKGADKEGKEKDQKKGSGGLPPGGAGGGSGAEDKSSEGKQSQKEAANAAFDELFGEKQQL